MFVDMISLHNTAVLAENVDTYRYSHLGNH